MSGHGHCPPLSRSAGHARSPDHRRADLGREEAAEHRHGLGGQEAQHREGQQGPAWQVWHKAQGARSASCCVGTGVSGAYPSLPCSPCQPSFFLPGHSAVTANSRLEAHFLLSYFYNFENSPKVSYFWWHWGLAQGLHRELQPLFYFETRSHQSAQCELNFAVLPQPPRVPGMEGWAKHAQLFKILTVSRHCFLPTVP